MLHPGDLVGVLEPGGAQLALVEALQGTKVRLRVGFDARPKLLPQRQLELLCPLDSSRAGPTSGGGEAPLSLGADPWTLTPERLSACLPSRRDWGEAWVLLSESEETIDLALLVELLCAEPGPPQLAACWLELVGEQLWFRYRQGHVQARGLADLRRLRQDRHRSRLQQQRQQAWLSLLRRRQPIEATELPEQQQQWLQDLAQLASGRLELEQLDPLLRRHLETLHLPSDRGALRHLLVDLGHWDRHRLVSLEGTPWSTGFSPELLQQAEELLQQSDEPQPGDAERLDLTNQHCVTIDDDDTRDIDDGLALERRAEGQRRLWIHVADPGRLVAANSPLDLEARRRGSSLYLAGGILPMFPASLSNGPFSLRQGIRSAAWSVWVELDPDGAISAYGIQRSWVKPTYRLSYADADDLIDLAPPEDTDLAEMAELLGRRRAWRQQRGALLMDLPEGRIRSHAGCAELEITEPGPSRQLVAEAMILAGTVVAGYGSEQGLALPYRSQLPAELPPPSELARLPEGPVRFAAIKRCLSRGLTGSRPAAHFSLGLPAYVQATSPIRRYGDLLVQRQLAAVLQGGSALDEAALQEQLELFEAAVREGIAISREDQRHWQQVWFEAHRSGQWRAQLLRWLRPQDRLALVRVEELALDLAAQCPAGLEPGQPLWVRVAAVDSLRDQLQLVGSAG